MAINTKKKGKEDREVNKFGKLQTYRNNERERKYYAKRGIKIDNPIKMNPSRLSTDNTKDERKRNIKASAKTQELDVGANPANSSHTSKKAANKFNRAKNKNADDEKLVAGMKMGTMKQILQKRVAEGKSIPENLKSKIKADVTKNDIVNRRLSGGKEVPERLKNGINASNSKIELKSNTPGYRQIKGKEDDPVMKELNEAYETCTNTGNYSQYKKAFDTICKILKIHNASAIGTIDEDFPSNGMMSFSCRVYYTKRMTLKQTDRLIHTSKEKGLTSLGPQFKSSDGVLYASPRVYFSKNSSMSKLGGSSGNGDYKYELLSPQSTAFVDGELGDPACYIETKSSLPVKLVE